MESDSIVSKDFMEKVLGRKIESFTVKGHDDTGNNFQSILYTFDVIVKNNSRTKNDQKSETDTLYLISKCYPNNPARQEFLNVQNIFHKEMLVYQKWIPELLKFQEELGIKEIVKPDCPKLIAAETINFEENQSGHNNKMGKIFRPFDIYIMMEDLCKTYDFKTVRLTTDGLDRDHVLLAIEAFAKLHALSWAYQNHKKIEVMEKEFPNFDFDYSGGDIKELMESLLKSTINETVMVLSNSSITLKVPTKNLIASITNFRDTALGAMEIFYNSCHRGAADVELIKYFRVKPEESSGKEIPWRVVIHGDSNLNNLLYRYNSENNKPEEIALVDLQLCRVACPIVELSFFMYSSTSAEFRKNHCDEMLDFYYEKFNYFCNRLKTKSLPDFTRQEIKRRFHRLKVMGFAIGLCSSSLFLKEKEDAVQLDSLEEMTSSEMISSLSKGMSQNKNFVERAISVIEEMYAQGVI